MTVEPTITLGTIINIIALVTTIIGGLLWLNAKIARLELKLNMMWNDFEKRMGLHGD